MADSGMERSGTERSEMPSGKRICFICGKEIDLEKDEWVLTPDGFAHNECYLESTEPDYSEITSMLGYDPYEDTSS